MIFVEGKIVGMDDRDVNITKKDGSKGSMKVRRLYIVDGGAPVEVRGDTGKDYKVDQKVRIQVRVRAWTDKGGGSHYDLFEVTKG